MSHVLGVYWAPGHQRPTDIDYMTRLQPPAIRVLDPDVNQMSIAHKAAPNALLLPRDWSLSEQHDDVRRDPVGTGKRHAQDWRNKIAVWRATGLKLPPDNQIIVVGINEMRVWDMLPQAVEYTVAMLDECTQLGLRACALNLSVGWPANNGPDTPPDWKPYAPIEAAIKRGNHFLTLHSYWYKSGPQDGAGWWAWRHHACPWDVPIIIGECSVDLYVDMKRWENDGKPNRGWRGNISPEQYAAQMEEYARGCDRRVVAILPFLTDYRSNNWESFDTQEAHGALLARKDNMVPQVRFATAPPRPTPPQPPVKPVEPVQPGPTRFVIAPAGANLRDTPGTTTAEKSTILKAVPYGESVEVLGVGANPQWLRVRHEGVEGWMFAQLLSDKPPVTPTPPQPPTKPYVPAPSEVLPTPRLGTVMAVELHIRSGPGTNYSIIGRLHAGNVVTVTATSGEWHQVGDWRWAHSTWIRLDDEPAPEQPAPVAGDEWSRAWPIVLKIEGGLSTDRSDKGNYRPDGTFVGTKWGISALSHPTVDIVNLTKEQALEIYHRNYWLGGGCDKLPWPMALLHFDAYVQNEVAAKKFLAASNGDPDLYMAERIDWYTKASTWDSHGRGWMRRCATMLREVANA